MKEKTKKVVFTVGVNCVGQPIVIEHIIDVDFKEKNFFEQCLVRKKMVKQTCGRAKHSKSKRHCGQSQKDIRVNHK